MKLKYFTFGLCAGLALTFGPGGFNGTAARAADHADSPTAAEDAPADIADCFFFVDPNDAAGTPVPQLDVVLGMTTHGFIVPGEAKNEAFFDPGVLYRFEIENTGDAKPDLFIEVRFSKRISPTAPQTATVSIPRPGKSPLVLTFPTTPPTISLSPNPLVVTTDATTGVKFAAGEADDPFFFDLPAFNQFVASVLAHDANPAAAFSRGRDTFAGYNVMAIAISIPAALIQGKSTNTKLGLSVATLRQTRLISAKGEIVGAGAFRQIDRMGLPAVNVALIPFADKDAYNASNPVDDAKKNDKFAPEIVATLTALGTNSTYIGILAGLAVTKGDILRLDLTIQNTGPEGGTNTAAAFPNGRRLADDTIDTILTLINNGVTLGDNVNASDILPIDVFPFFAPPHQPLASGVDDDTRN